RGKGRLDRWDNRKGYIRLQAGSFRYGRYKGSELWKNGIPLSGSHRFRWCQKQNPRGRYPAKTGDEGKSSRTGPDEGRRSPRWTCPRPENPISYLPSSQDEPF